MYLKVLVSDICNRPEIHKQTCLIVKRAWLFYRVTLTSCLRIISAIVVMGIVRVRDSMATSDDVRKHALKTTNITLQWIKFKCLQVVALTCWYIQCLHVIVLASVDK